MKTKVIVKWGRKLSAVRRKCINSKCGKMFWAAVFNVKLGKGCCSKSCANSLRALAHPRKQTGSDNPNWKGGVSGNAIVYKNRSVARYPERAAARKITEQAIRSGLLIRNPCEVKTCGDPKSESHHEDYSKPLDVKWLCRFHHIRADAKRRSRERFLQG